jgi:hypothetical protein
VAIIPTSRRVRRRTENLKSARAHSKFEANMGCILKHFLKKTKRKKEEGRKVNFYIDDEWKG